MPTHDLDESIRAAHAALEAMMNADPGPSVALWSRRDDVVLANPLGPPIVGCDNVTRETVRVASTFSGGEGVRVEEYSRFEAADVAYVVAIERARVKRPGSNEMTPLELRVTVVWRREQDGWRMAVRHADRVTGTLPAGGS